MSDEGWQRRFDDPIQVDDRTLRTLRDAADYIMELPPKTSRQPRWQTAVRELMIAAERGGILMLARVAMMVAINHGKPAPERTSSGKSHHWGKRKLKRDR